MTISICIPTFNRLSYLKEIMGTLLPLVALFGTVGQNADTGVFIVLEGERLKNFMATENGGCW